jgi:hypothetical protein
MIRRRIVAAFAGFMSLVALSLGASPVSAAPVSSGSAPTSQQAATAAKDLVSTVRYHRRGYYGRSYYRRPVYYRRPIYRRPVYVRPYYRPVRCGVVYRRVWNGYGWVSRPVRVCR